ncbi:hypothetical protein [Magnetospirillum sp. 64-120]|uniref:hypothetical protein n=1 Tax=Magnetospirillum sp. 64-120 TaxID=1895778 RepID=UPI000925BB3D|nr:hypothetical protein [Magnetospirillum sp. 64-120]OJX79350.1 MAG: hypothetical protein BGO92_12750 [Magnetospirillum sp. 64-120]
MSAPKSDTFENKVADLVAVTQQLDVMRIVMLRRLTLADPQSLKWASARQLDLIFTVILSKALERTDPAQVVAASNQHFDPFLPPGPEEQQDKERWLLFDLAKPILDGAAQNAQGTTEAVLDELQADSQDEQPESYSDFGTLFDDTISRYLKRTLSVLSPSGTRPHIPLPFYAAPAFTSCYLHVVRDIILPQLRASRRLKELATSRNWSEAGAASRLIGIIQAGEDNNPILHHWDSRWQASHPDHVAKDKTGKVKPKKDEENPWPLFREDAEKHGYVPPYPADIPMLQRLLRLDGDVLGEAWDHLAHLYEQEFQPKHRHDQGRPGSFRDGLLKFIDELDHHGGDLLTIRAFFEFPKVDRLFIKQLIQMMGRSDKERMMRAPLVINFYNDLPK